MTACFELGNNASETSQQDQHRNLQEEPEIAGITISEGIRKQHSEDGGGEHSELNDYISNRRDHIADGTDCVGDEGTLTVLNDLREDGNEHEGISRSFQDNSCEYKSYILG